jgi:transposase
LETELLNLIPESLRERVAEAFSKLQKLESENVLLREQIRLILIKKYGPKSERLSDGQLSLLELEPVVLAGEVETEAGLPAEAKASTPEAQPGQGEGQPKAGKSTPVRKPLPAHLPREERIVPCPQADCQCPQCGGEKRVIGYETSERLSLKPVVYYVEVTKREKRACPRCEELGVSVAPVPAAIVEKGLLSDRLVVDTLIKKYVEHAPLYRQALSIKRDADLEISQVTLCNAMMKCGELLKPVCGAMRADLLAGDYLQADETTTPVQDRATKGRNHQAYLWEYGRPDGPVVYDFRMGREREGPRNFLKDYKGRLQTDGYAAYNHAGAEGMTHFACWAHARRKFMEALQVDPEDARAAAILKKIRELYDVESFAKEAGLDAARREAVRKEKSVPILGEIKAMVLEAKAAVLPQGRLGKACAYTLSLWGRLERYAAAGNGMVEIDNNGAERGMRPVCLGRKNWLHIGSKEAGPKVAAIMSVVETCKRRKIDLRKYLVDVLPRIADWPASQVAKLTPMAWAAESSRSET